jgi:23S rRNA (cytosine1962-C5)-methyltransferase
VERIKIVLKSGKDQSPLRFHPWIFSGAIKKIYGNPVEGDVVDVYDNKNTLLGVGHYAPGSIAVRILAFGDVAPDADFFRNRINLQLVSEKRQVFSIIPIPMFSA